MQVRRVTKVVKGGKQLSFRAVVVVGDGKGSVGVGCASAKEVHRRLSPRSFMSGSTAALQPLHPGPNAHFSMWRFGDGAGRHRLVAERRRYFHRVCVCLHRRSRSQCSARWRWPSGRRSPSR